MGRVWVSVLCGILSADLSRCHKIMQDVSWPCVHFWVLGPILELVNWVWSNVLNGVLRIGRAELEAEREH